MDIWQWITVAIFFATLASLFKYQQHPERVFCGAALACLAVNIISVEDILHNAVNPGLVTLLLLVTCSFALERTRFLRTLAAAIFNGSARKSYFKTIFTTAIASAFLNNTAVVAAMISPVKKNKLINPGRLLIPLSYAAILGGTLTLIGTSTNLIVNSMLIEKGIGRASCRERVYAPV